jgi:5-methyltetrahydrofolate--homocysteine methyltransferase
VEETYENYAELREEHYSSMEDRKYVPLSIARQRKLAIDFASKPPAPAPRFTGTKVRSCDTYWLTLVELQNT